jgi:polyisoprenoid-binding protein YceI
LNRKLLLIGGGALAIVAIAAFVIFGVLLREPEAASAPIQAVPLASATNGSAPTAQGGPAAEAAPTSAAATSGAPSADQVLFQIVPEQSEARFRLDEVLRGEPKTVIGKTNQVAGQIAINPKDLSASQIGKIQINARTLATDEDRRNRAINNFILQTDSFEMISFEPTSISGLSGSGAVGQPYSFDIAGNLTIRDVTKPVVFKAQVQAESDKKLVGSASTTIKRADYNLNIPNVPFVANVSEDVALELSFVAAPVQ